MMKKKIKIVHIACIIVIGILLIIIGYIPPFRDRDIGKQWYIKNDGVCEDIEMDTEFCKISNFKKDIDISISDIWKEKLKNQNEVVVAIIDTGIDFLHEDLRNVAWSNPGEIPNDGIDNDNNGFIDDINGWNFRENNNNLLTGEEIYENDHATMEAGIISANHNFKGIAGIAGKCKVKIMSIKILTGLTWEGTVEDLRKGIEYADKMGADICNLSLGYTTKHSEIKELIANSSMLFVTSAGNEGKDIDIRKQYPASYKLNNLITVASMGFDGNIDSDSNYGKKSVDVIAPGVYLYSTCVENRYNYDSGTSLAAAIVTGIAAIMYANKDNITAQEVKQDICKNVTKVREFENLASTSGYVNARLAIDDFLFQRDNLQNKQ